MSSEGFGVDGEYVPMTWRMHGDSRRSTMCITMGMYGYYHGYYVRRRIDANFLSLASGALAPQLQLQSH